jgi:ABC-type dipeptide/oligopeptide/nickel transport system ATPase component
MLLDASLSLGYPGRPRVLDGFELSLAPGEVCGLAGPSGSGKSTFGLALLGLHDRAQIEGKLQFDHRDLTRLSEGEWRNVRGREIALVPQSPLASLNPRLSVAAHFREAWSVHARGDWRAAVREALHAAQLDYSEDLLGKRPRQLSVGMAQRVLIAMAVLHRPKLIVADEATSALDLIAQAGILSLFRELRDRYGLSVLFITHDLAAAGSVCDRLAILHQGRVVEHGPAAQVLAAPRHAYTQALVAALPAPVFTA